ncbi:sugar transferase [Methylobacterium persicinum]|uniref:Lipopolysaccharide/colanic/teichoic acid biosynthesis glycosyltransferase n=1 Tax=Methylobacterium persicinum TaxID=374426 RepID=A0ABU0HN06_9HYPH|nr:sugar transferase [Methylobacterium persicinum]MDQ0443700.1 lipopolysaccharide/colanic/teichoic acid biosynthesis glycosyltransferase [Methylobacterium persicinum]GJE40173.1 hypothetical protein KHHGKMAE_4263 [Methylobacterium persicinum]
MLQVSLRQQEGPSKHIAQAAVAGTSGGAARTIRRFLDVSVALTALILLAPLMTMLAILVALDGGPVLFRHPRIGKGGRPFGCLKFRTMIDDAEAAFSEYLSYHPPAGPEWDSERTVSFDPRVTAIGRWLRATSLDELPQLFNVLRGEMSLVGPRAGSAAEAPLPGEPASACPSVLPGLTGPWQVGDRGQPDERSLREWGFLRDIALLARATIVVVRRKGVS